MTNCQNCQNCQNQLWHCLLPTAITFIMAVAVVPAYDSDGLLPRLWQQFTASSARPWPVECNHTTRRSDCNHATRQADGILFLTFAFCCRNAVECSSEHKLADRLFYNCYDGKCRSLAPHHEVFNPPMQNHGKIAIKTRPATYGYNIRQGN